MYTNTCDWMRTPLNLFYLSFVRFGGYFRKPHKTHVFKMRVFFFIIFTFFYIDLWGCVLLLYILCERTKQINLLLLSCFILLFCLTYIYVLGWSVNIGRNHKNKITQSILRFVRSFSFFFFNIILCNFLHLRISFHFLFKETNELCYSTNVLSFNSTIRTFLKYVFPLKTSRKLILFTILRKSIAPVRLLSLISGARYAAQLTCVLNKIVAVIRWFKKKKLYNFFSQVWLHIKKKN